MGKNKAAVNLTYLTYAVIWIIFIEVMIILCMRLTQCLKDRHQVKAIRKAALVRKISSSAFDNAVGMPDRIETEQNIV